MKKICSIALALLLFSILGACGQPAAGDGTDTTAAPTHTSATQEETVEILPFEAAEANGKEYEIKEKMFIASCNDIYMNPDEYAGVKVTIEGIYDVQTDESTGETWYSVIRYGPGCCGNDGVAGFEFVPSAVPNAQRNDWVRVEGIASPYKYYGDNVTVLLGDAAVEVLDERGTEFVAQ
ncbi:MAG: hypothetical protein LBB67_00305 [Oscillospiraceae bacterium]|jgi:uncharacterized membrane protein YcgQ (UPF0703/DUF1980 family)|nr:hypothetical protein [Oscillospiraceae bacterium]